MQMMFGQKPRKVIEVKVGRKVWTIEVHVNRFGNVFVKAKQMTIYDTLLEVQLYKMPYDGQVFAYEVRHQLLDDEVLSALKREMLKVREEFYK